MCLLTSGGVVAADAVLMCVGEGGEGAFADFGGMRGFIPGLWATEQIASIPRQTKVAVAGTSLSAVDVVGQLRAQGHEGPIYACARTRGLPKVQGPREGYTMRTLTDEWRSRHCATSDALPIAVVARGLRDELDHAIGRPYDPSRVDPREIFSRRDRQARSALPELAVLSESITQANTGNHWASVMEALGEMTPSVWHAIAMEDRAQFLRARYGIWSEYRHPIPLQNAEMLRDAMTDGQLTVHKGVQSVRPYGSGWRTTTAGTDITSDYLVDVTGFHLPRRLNRHKLLSSMLDRQMLSPHPLGGVRVDIDTCRVQSPVGAPTLALYVAGALTVGTHLYTNALETNVANATRAAHDLVHALTAANPLRRERSGHERAPVRYA